MNRRTFLTSAAVVGISVSGSGCLGILGGEEGGKDDDGWERVDDSAPQGSTEAYRIDFIDQTGTLGQVAQPQTEQNDYNNIVNEYSEEEWQEMDDNDLSKARNEIEESGRGSIEALRSHVEQELENSPEDEADERALARGIGIGMNEETGISDSFSSAHVLKPVTEKFAEEYLDNDVQAWITGATEAATEGRFAHLPITMVYEEDGELVRDYVEPSVPEAVGLGGNGKAIRRPEESEYANPDNRETVTGHEYRKALEMAHNGQIEQEGRANPVRAVSTAVLADLWSIVDSAENDLSFDNPPPNGLVTHVSQEFGESVEDAFYDLDEQKLGYMENIGKGVQLVYEEHGGRANLAVGGTLDEPEFYFFPDDNKEDAWNFNYNDIAELTELSE